MCHIEQHKGQEFFVTREGLHFFCNGTFIDMEKLISLTGIKQGEEKLAGLSALYALLIGVSQVWLKSIPVSLFLTRFSAATLPYAYIASAIVLVVFGIIYGQMEKRVSATRLLHLFIILLAIGFFIFWFFLQPLAIKEIYLIFFIFSAASFDVFDLGLWGVLNRLFTLDQAKRMFGFIGLCQTVAGIIGNLLIPFLFFFIVPADVILGVSICISCAALLLKVIFRKYPNRFNHTVPKINVEETQESKKVKWLKSSYLVNNMLFAIFSLFTYTIVDITFFNVNKEVFPTDIQLASFLGIFFAITNSFDFLCRGLVAPLVINKLGVNVGLLIRPLAVGSIALTLLLLTPFNIELHTIFLLVALMKLFDEGISNSILRQSVLILYQPLLPNLRSWLQTRIELFIIPLSTILASIIFIIIQYYFSLDFVYITLVILILVIATLWLIFFLQKGYVDNLKRAITKQFFLFKSQILDKDFKKFFLEKLTSGTPFEIVYCLDLLEKMNLSDFVRGLSLCLNNPNGLIKQAALKKLQHFQSNQLVFKIKKILKEDLDPQLRAQAFLALIFQKTKTFDKDLKSYFDSIELVLNDGAIIASLQSSLDSTLEQETREKVFKIINSTHLNKRVQVIQEKLFKLIHSSSSIERVQAAKILGQLGIEKDPCHDLLLLFEDKDPSVVRAVIEVVPSFQDKKLYQRLAKALNRDELRSSATLAFIKAKDKGLPSLIDSLNLALEHQDFKMTNAIFKIIGHLQTPAAIQTLLQHLRMTNNLTLKWQVLQALDICGYQARLLSEKKELNAFLIQAADQLNKVLKWIGQIGNQSGYKLLTKTLIRHTQSSLQQIFLILRLLYQKKMIHDIAFYFKHENIDKVSYAQELLENILDAKHKKILFPLLKECNFDNLILKQSAKLDTAILFKEILESPTIELSNVLKSTVIYLIGYHQLKHFTQAALEASGDLDEMVSETAKWTLTKLNYGSTL